MPGQENSIFRKESLEKLSSPERLDQLMQVIKAKDWLPLSTLGVLVVLAIVWSILGRIPVTVSGRGVLLQTQKLKSFPTTQANLANTASLANVAYFTIGDGKRIEPGMRVMLTPDTVKREEFGSIVGIVTSVSPFPITTESATELIGNGELAASLISQTGKMQVVAQLETDETTFSGYKWTSDKGSPRQQLSPGTTTSVRVILSEQAPISLVFPMLRSEN